MTLSTSAMAGFVVLLLGAGTAGCGTGSPVLPPATPADDAAITSGVKAAIGRSADLHATDIDVATSEGIVQLSGYVSSADSVSTAASVARTVKGVKFVRNELRLK